MTELHKVEMSIILSPRNDSVGLGFALFISSALSFSALYSHCLWDKEPSGGVNKDNLSSFENILIVDIIGDWDSTMNPQDCDFFLLVPFHLLSVIYERSLNGRSRLRRDY